MPERKTLNQELEIILAARAILMDLGPIQFDEAVKIGNRIQVKGGGHKVLERCGICNIHGSRRGDCPGPNGNFIHKIPDSRDGTNCNIFRILQDPESNSNQRIVKHGMVVFYSAERKDGRVVVEGPNDAIDTCRTECPLFIVKGGQCMGARNGVIDRLPKNTKGARCNIDDFKDQI